MTDVGIPTFDELLASIPDAHKMSGIQLTAAIAAAEADEVFRQLFAQLAETESK